MTSEGDTKPTAKTSHDSITAKDCNNLMLCQENCLICGDVASGKHYGLRSCEACKAFFKRTVQGKIEYSCPASKECEINKRRRKACQACRFQKCLRMGMLKEGVRLDRVRGGRQKYRRGQSPTSASGNGNSGAAGPTIGSTSSTSSSHHVPTTTHNSALFTSSSPSTGCKSFETNRIMTALIHCEPDELAALTPHVVSHLPTSLSAQLKTLYILSDLFDRELVSLIGWAKQIPGFSETISLNDQMRLLQSTWAEIIALSIAYRSHLKRIELQQLHNAPSPTSSTTPGSSTSSSSTSSSGSSSSSMLSSSSGVDYNSEIRLVFARDFIMDYKHALACDADAIFFNCVQLIKRLDHLKITPKEYMILKALSLTNADVRLENVKTAHNLRDVILETLYETVQALVAPESLGLHSSSSPYNPLLSTLSNHHSSANRQSPSLNQLLTPSPSSSTPTSDNSLLGTSMFNNSTCSSSLAATGGVACLSNTIVGTTTSTAIGSVSNNNSHNGSLASRQSLAINLRLNQILLCLPVLRQIDTSLRKFWNDIRKGSLNVPMNKLFEEMLEPCQRIYKSTVEM
ncbi:Steroid hormone receptor ERR2 [Fragariocoptes setiger]|uniref:Steroid hormone receptor ERR2 n=1 Tax=Fragariocoptes setiger TaxID=1670756 RepID=A0ABQ7S7Y0_9ACAR|nr:Steroid hormone receptor ERR2 [Fragariocoptes setiger]